MRKHGVADRNVLHAYDHPIRVFDLDDGFTILIGATAAGALIEVGAVESVTGPVIVHATRARTTFVKG